MSSNSVTLNELDVKKLTKIWRVFDKLFRFDELPPSTKVQIVETLRGDRNVLFSRHPGLRNHPLMTWGALSTASKKDVAQLLRIAHEGHQVE